MYYISKRTFPTTSSIRKTIIDGTPGRPYTRSVVLWETKVSVDAETMSTESWRYLLRVVERAADRLNVILPWENVSDVESEVKLGLDRFVERYVSIREES